MTASIGFASRRLHPRDLFDEVMARFILAFIPNLKRRLNSQFQSLSMRNCRVPRDYIAMRSRCLLESRRFLF